ncbi:hypothetical protein DNK77_18730 [Enterobacter cloacae complex sp.]|nr:hypothetical protein D9T11_04180 [Enterobacter kobei]PYZ34109.1 hypothetical protein DNK77_18730 [Enterobacter cloacae complex sp.]RAY66835.1 hypothetical protein DP199_21585 [Enterobacter kobei]
MINLTPCRLTVKKDALHTSVAPFCTCKFLNTAMAGEYATVSLSRFINRKTAIPESTMLGWLAIDNDGNKHVRQCFENCHTPKPSRALAGTLC